jgi:hypothetical protein
MRALLSVVVAVLIGGCGYGSSEVNVDCGKPPDFVQWRDANRRDNMFKEGEPERVRRSVAAHLVKCHTLHGKSQAAVLGLLGRGGLPDKETPRDEQNTWDFYLGPDGLHIDDEVMLVVFGRDRRVKQVIVAQT